MTTRGGGSLCRDLRSALALVGFLAFANPASANTSSSANLNQEYVGNGAGLRLPDSEPSPSKPTLTENLYNAQAIASFLRRLPPMQGEMLSILQIGDSHTAGDALTNGWRQSWQAEYGFGGRGMMAVGRPYQGYLTHGVTARQSPEWNVNSLFGKAHVAIGPALGLSGFTQSVAYQGATLSLAADTPDFMFDQFSLCGLTGGGRGAVSIVMGGISRKIDFSAPASGAACYTETTEKPVSEVTIITQDDRPVSLTSWQTRRSSGGILLSNLGVVGSRFAHFSRNDDAVLGGELRLVRPDLLVIAFGTNEGFDPTLKLQDAKDNLRGQILRIRRLLGYRVPILLLGPPDAASNRPAVALPEQDDTQNCGNGWWVPGNLARIRALQTRLAKELDVAFWDWQRSMGGACSTMRWVAQGLQRNDHVHFTTEGGRRLGEALAADLDRARQSSVK